MTTRKFLPFLCLIVAAGCASQATDESENPLSIAQPLNGEKALPTVFVFGSKPGSLTIDASKRQVDFPLPTKIRSFENWDAFVGFAMKELNAERVVNPKTGATSVRGHLTQYDVPYYGDEQGQAIPIDDAVAAYVGGTAGYFVVAGEKISVRDDSVQPRANHATTRCNSANSYCITGNAWITHLFLYHQVGSSTVQGTGGTRTTWYYGCPSWPWVCWSTTASNALVVSQTMWSDVFPAISSSASGFAVREVAVAEYEFGYETGANDPIAHADSNCTSHVGSDNGDGVSFAWGEGWRCGF